MNINSNNSNHCNIKAIILDNWGRNEEALKYYDKSLKIRNDSVVRGNKAQCLYRIARNHVMSDNITQKDLDTINRALAILPDDDGRNDYIRVKGQI